MNDLMTLTAAVTQNRCGFTGEMLQENLPTGWVSIELFPVPRDPDMAQFYVGPVITDNDDWIEIDVFGKPMTFSRDRVIVTPAL
jgi:hypothetical protein